MKRSIMTFILALLSAGVTRAGQLKVIEIVSFDYPAFARNASLEGQLGLRLKVDNKGTVLAVEIVTGEKMMFSPPAMRAIESWRFEGCTTAAPCETMLHVKMKLVGPPTHSACTKFVFQYPNTVVLTAAPALASID
jgi:TonB family protein